MSAPENGSPDLEAVARRAVEAGVAAGADEAEAWCERSVSRTIRVYQGEVESLTESQGRGLGLRVFRAGAGGYASGTDLSGAGVEALAGQAVAAAGVTDPDESAGLPEQPGSAAVSGLASAALGEWTTERKAGLAREAERAARERDGRISQVEQTVYSDGEGWVALCNSRGFAGAYEQTEAYCYLQAFAGEGAELMTGLGLGLGRDPEAIDPAAVGEEAADRALALLGARQPRSRRCPVVLDPFVSASFLGIVGGALSAEAVQRGRSLFAGRLEEEVADAAVELADDGLDPEGFGTAPFDGEGIAQRRTALIEAGVLRTFLHDSTTARREGGGAAPTGNARRGSYRSQPSVGTTNLVLSPGDASREELLRSAGDGFYVMEVAGLHSGVNPTSGSFSVGASGRLIEGGELAAPVREATIASDLVSMLRGVSAVESEARWVPFGGSVKAPALLVAEMTVSGE